MRTKKMAFLDFSLVEFEPKSSSALDILGLESFNPDKTVLSVSIERDPDYGYGTVEEKRLDEYLSDLLVIARRSALKIDKSVDLALNYLDQLAS